MPNRNIMTVVFHRVIPTFMIQGGGFDKNLDKKTTGMMPPIKNEWKNSLKNLRGTIAMARTSDPDSATSQFSSTWSTMPP